MPTVTTRTVTLWYADHRRDSCDLPPVLLMHGAGTHRDWSIQIRRALCAITPDLPGHGKSLPPGRDRVEAYAEDMIALLDTLHIERAVIGGHSMGGVIALALALTYPERVRGLVLVATGARIAVHPDLIARVTTDPVGVLARVSAWSWASGFDALRAQGREALMGIDPAVLQGDYQACAAFDARDRLDAVRAPTLIVGGMDDRMIPFAQSVLLHEGITGSELVTIEGGGHMLMLEQPEQVADAIEAWVRRRCLNTDGASG